MAGSSRNYIPQSSPAIPGNPKLPPPANMKTYGDFSSPTGVSMRDLTGRFTAGGWGFQWVGLESVMALPAQFAEVLYDNLEKNLDNLADEIEKYAKDNAPWTDRTGNARSGLHTTHDSSRTTGKFIINLGYSVDYGFFLETYDGGKFAIVGPTMQHFAPDLAELATEGLR
jgi:hypothetical protein